MSDLQQKVVVIGAGMGGLAAALRLSHAGCAVTVLERHSHPGGKMRTVPSPAGPVDAGPTVLTMRHVFDALFKECGGTLDDHVTLEAETLLARHWWRDGTTLDLFADPEATATAIRAFAGPRGEQDFRRFNARTKRLYEAFKGPMMEAAEPSQAALTAHVLRNPSLIPDMSPHATLMSSLSRQFRDKRLSQLFGRYATYVGGSPLQSPALLALIWQSEAAGVWRVAGGMHKLATAIADFARSKGATFAYNTHVARIEVQGSRATSVITEDGTRYPADHIIFNGDPAALGHGYLGQKAAASVTRDATRPRSLSAYVHSFASIARGPELAYHNVFFGANPRDEFDPIAAGKMPRDPTLYICAEDRGGGTIPDGPERFEIIMNAPPHAAGAPEDPMEKEQCQTLVFQTLRRFGLTFGPTPGPGTLTMPSDFQALFPGSDGSLYGRSPHGLMAAFQRPTARSRLPGLYLAGGGAHPGAGIPMATLSGRHAAEAILTDLASTSRSLRMDTRGGMSTASRTAEPMQSPSSGS